MDEGSPEANGSETCPNELSQLVLAVEGITRTGDRVLPANYKRSFPRREAMLLDAIAKICARQFECYRAVVALDKAQDQITLYIATEPPPSPSMYEDIEWLLENPADACGDVSSEFIAKAYSFVVYYELEAVAKKIPDYEALFAALENDPHIHDTPTPGTVSSDAPRTIQCPMKDLRSHITDLASRLAEVGIRTDEEGYIEHDALLRVHCVCLAVLKDIDLVTKRCGVWSDDSTTFVMRSSQPSTHFEVCTDEREVFTILCRFAEYVQMVAWERARLVKHPWTTVWATQEALPCAVDLDESFLTRLLSEFDIDGDEGNRDAFNVILKNIRDFRTSSPPTANYAHAESALIRILLDSGASGDLFLGTSDDTCYACCEYLQAVNKIHGTMFRLRACS